MSSVDLAPNNPYGLPLRAPVMTAAGCLGFGVEYERIIPLKHLGAIVTGSISLHGRRALPPLRLVETPGGVLSVGAWRDPGLTRVLCEYAPAWAAWETPVILSVAADHREVAAALEGVEGIAGIELTFGDDWSAAVRVVAAVRAVTLLPLLVKLPLHARLIATARSVVDAGADAVTIAAPPRASAADPHTGELVHGWLSGPAIRPLVLEAVAEVCATLPAPVVACGGIVTAADAQPFLAAGAIAVQVGSALLANPWAAVRIAEALENAP
ncbi:nitronate monooxygenase [Roseiflexus castenholzii]|uniref:nitronate monooxygenase n=1 Tax=Roseiflexus castenholzii TaxID=120962 RepID=UPI003C7AF791